LTITLILLYNKYKSNFYIKYLTKGEKYSTRRLRFMQKQLYPISSYKKSVNGINVENIIGISYLVLDKDKKLDIEVHDFWEFLYVDKGKCAFLRNGKELKLEQGDVVFLSPNTFCSVCADRANPPVLFILSFTSKSRCMKHFENLYMPLTSVFSQLILDMYSEGQRTFDMSTYNPITRQLNPLKQPVWGGAQLIMTYLEQFLIKLVRRKANPRAYCSYSANATPFVRKIAKMLQENVYGKLSLDDICSAVGYGKAYACREFKKYMGMTIMKYYTMFKILEAKKLIRGRKHNFTQISSMLMFSDSHHFTNVFFKKTSMTPSQYSKSVKSD